MSGHAATRAYQIRVNGIESPYIDYHRFQPESPKGTLLMLKIPPADSPLCAHFDVNTLAVIEKVPTLAQFRASANVHFKNGSEAAYHSVVLRADGRVTLERIGRRGGRKTLWTFQGATTQRSSPRSQSRKALARKGR